MSAVIGLLGIRHARGVAVDVIPVQAQSLVQTVIATGRVMSRARFEEVERAYRIAKSQHEAAQTQVKAQRQSGAQTRDAVAKLSEAIAARELAAAKLNQTTEDSYTLSLVVLCPRPTMNRRAHSTKPGTPGSEGTSVPFVR